MERTEPRGAFLIERESRIVEISDAYADLLGYPAASLRGKPVASVVADRDRSRLSTYGMRRSVTTFVPRSYEFVAVRRDGTQVRLLAQVTTRGSGPETTITTSVTPVPASIQDESLDELYSTYAPLVHGLMVRILGDGVDARECLQETFECARRDRNLFERSRETLTSWLLDLGHSLAIARLRSRPAMPIPDAGDLASQSDSGPLAGLPRMQRTVLELAYFGGLNPQQIAERTGLTRAQVTAELRDGMWTLRGVCGLQGRAELPPQVRFEATGLSQANS